MSTQKLFLVATFAVTLSLPVVAVDYYVSTTAGNDQFDGRSSEGFGTLVPFASVQPLQAITLRHGDRILLRCGERFAAPLALIMNSQDAGELTLGSYGNCNGQNKPVLDGRVPLAVTATGELQQVSEATRIEQIFAGDMPLQRARFPATSYLILPERTTPSKTSLAPFATLIGQHLHGAKLHARTEEWFIEERAVTDTTGLLDTPLQYPLRPKNGFYLTGKSWMVGDTDTWSYDASERRLAVRAPRGAALSKVPSGHLVRITGKGSITISGIDFDAAGGDAINTRLDGVVSIINVGIKRAVGNGISIAGARNAFVVNSSIGDVGLDAIFFAETKRVFIRRNRITNAGLYTGPRPSLAAINAHRTDSATIEENIVENSAYIGIRFAGDARIRQNYVSQSCLFLSDCAAIYTWRRNAQDRRPKSEVIGNVIDGVKGNTSVKLGVNDYFAGIYLDEFSNEVLVANNIITDVNQGIYLHNAYNNEVRNNIVRARKSTMLDAADKVKNPVLANTTNTVHLNSERLGDFGLTLIDAAGLRTAFSFNQALKAELAPMRLVAPASQANRNCIQDEALQPEVPEKPRNAVVSAANCD